MSHVMDNELRKLLLDLRGEITAVNDKVDMNCGKLDSLKDGFNELRGEVASYAEMTQAAGENVVAQGERFDKLESHVTNEIAGVNEKLDKLLKE